MSRPASGVLKLQIGQFCVRYLFNELDIISDDYALTIFNYEVEIDKKPQTLQVTEIMT